MNFHFSFYSLLEGVNLLVSSGTASAIAGDRLCMVKRKTARKDDTKVSITNVLGAGYAQLLTSGVFYSVSQTYQVFYHMAHHLKKTN